MSLKAARNFLSFLLCVIIVMGGMVSVSEVVAHYTICSPRYARHQLSADIIQQNKKSFEERIDALEAKSGIPARVFTAVYNVDTLNNAIVDSVYAGKDTTLYSIERIDEFEKYCKEYLDGNEIKYNDEYVHQTAIEAARIYSECFGIDNAEAIYSVVERINAQYQTNLSFGLMLMVLAGVMLIVLFSKGKDVIKRVFAALSSLGFALAFGSVGCLIAGIGQHALVYPSVYENVINRSVTGAFVICIAIGFVLSIGFLSANIIMYAENEKKLQEDY